MEEISYWKDQLGSFPSEIKNSLKISYGTLAEEEQHIVLDICIFFQRREQGYGHKHIEQIRLERKAGASKTTGQISCRSSEASKTTGQISCRSSEYDTYAHDHQKDLGRDIAACSSPRRICSWTENVIGDLLQRQYGS
jgi:hypothetical protein